MFVTSHPYQHAASKVGSLHRVFILTEEFSGQSRNSRSKVSVTGMSDPSYGKREAARDTEKLIQNKATQSTKAEGARKSKEDVLLNIFT